MSTNTRSRHFLSAILFAGIVAFPVVPAFAQSLSYMPAARDVAAFPQYAPQDEQQGDVADDADQLPAQLRRQVVSSPGTEAPGTVIIDTGHTFLYLTLGNGKALR
jgi:lipoprotein-anchoring transpeptidase ErfK/SrfK